MDTNIKKLLSQILENTDKINATLNEHTKILNEHSKILDEHTKILGEHTKILDEHGKRLDHIENDFGSRLDHIENDFGNRLQNIENDFGSRLQNIENIVTRIETEHGQKIQVLFDYFVTDSNRFAELRQEIFKINSKLDDLDNRIYALDFYKKNLLISQ